MSCRKRPDKGLVFKKGGIQANTSELDIKGGIGVYKVKGKERAIWTEPSVKRGIA